MMTNTRFSIAAIGMLALALAMALPADVLAQASGNLPRAGAAGTEDMRLWSFGECDQRFPYSNSAEHMECVRVVGSAEARDARALRVCEVGHAKDKTEIERCKSTYQSNKEMALRDGVVPNTKAVPLAPPSPEVMQRVKAITMAAVEQQRAAAAEADTAPAEEEAPPANVEPERSSPMTMIAVVSLALLLLGLAATVHRRRQAGSV